MKTSLIPSGAYRLSTMVDALVRRFGSAGSGEGSAAEEPWLGWDAWVRVVGDVQGPGQH